MSLLVRYQPLREKDLLELFHPKAVDKVHLRWQFISSLVICAYLKEKSLTSVPGLTLKENHLPLCQDWLGERLIELSSFGGTPCILFASTYWKGALGAALLSLTRDDWMFHYGKSSHLATIVASLDWALQLGVGLKFIRRVCIFYRLPDPWSPY